MKKALIGLLIVLAGVGCKSVNNQLYPQVSFFDDAQNLSVSVVDRIKDAPPHVISWLNDMDSTDTYASYSLTDEEHRLFSGYYALLPEIYQRTMEEKVIAIYFIENFLGGGMTCGAFDHDGYLYMILFFNPEILRCSITDWINFRENSCFNDDAHTITVNAECTGEYCALLHTLFHEASHVYDYHYHITPFTELYFKHDDSPLKTGFTDMIWADYDLPVMEYNFPHRNELHSYGLGPAQSKKRAFDIYESLSKTPFPTVYGSQNWAEDFAESFTWFYL